MGIARALMLDPLLLLMDEPFGALDPITRRQMQTEFKKLESGINTTIVFVTQDIEEALLLGDRVAIMDAGRIVQCDTPETLRTRPASDFVHAFVGG